LDDRFIDIHTHTLRPGITCLLSWSFGRDGGTLPDAPYVSAGIHPWDAESVDLDAALAFLADAPVAAIGEAGLDFAKPIDRERQAAVFGAQLDIAEKRGLPVVIHCVRAYGEVLQMLRGRRLKAVIFHGYTGSPEQTARIIGSGYYISVGATSLGSAKTVVSLREAPLDHIFAETDTGDTPIEDIYGGIAEVKGLELPALQRAIETNFETIFE
jgi:TatD DNase family protein